MMSMDIPHLDLTQADSEDFNEVYFAHPEDVPSPNEEAVLREFLEQFESEWGAESYVPPSMLALGDQDD